MADSITLPNGGKIELPNKKEVVKQLDQYHKAIDMLTPVVNQYHAAFGGMEAIQQGLTDAKNAVVKAKTALSG